MNTYVLDIQTNRKSYTHYLRGQGIEIGALDGPLTISHNKAKVKYMDYKSTEDLHKHFPTLKNIVDVDLVTSGEDLSIIPGESLDFVIANHVIEHVISPITTLAVWHSKLREGGILFLAFPLPEYCADKVRPLTKVEHLIDEHEKTASKSREEHWLSFTWAWNPGYFKDPEEVKRVLEYLWRSDKYEMDNKGWNMLDKSLDDVKRLFAINETNLHHHTFNFESMIRIFEVLSERYKVHFTIEDISLTKGCLSENILILKKRPSAPVDIMTDHAYAAQERETLLAAIISEKNAYIQQQRGAMDQLQSLFLKRDR